LERFSCIQFSDLGARLLEVRDARLIDPIRLLLTALDYAELATPPIFSYGFFLPQVILIFIICLVYSILRESWKLQLAGLAYFVIGHYVYKYQLLYAMDNNQHSTGRAWMMICDRVFAGIILFQLTMAGQLALQKAWKLSVVIIPLLAATLWFAYAFSQAYRPLMEFIALRSIRRAEHVERGRTRESTPADGEGDGMMPPGPHIEEINEAGQKYVNPSLVIP
jgi:calcium permeable stress-gated cation channel